MSDDLGEVYYLSEKDRANLNELSRRSRIHPRNLRSTLDIPKWDVWNPEVYVALTPGKGIKARQGLEVFQSECNIYQVSVRAPNGTGTGTGGTASWLTGTGSALTERFLLQEVRDLGRQVFNLSEELIAGDSYVMVVRDKFGRWFPVGMGGGKNNGRALLLISPGEPIQVAIGTACGTGTANDDCGMIYHRAYILEPDPVCQDYVMSGRCAWATDLLGRRLVPNRMYWGDFLGPRPSKLEFVIIGIDPDNPTIRCDSDDMPVYSVDMGDPARTIKVGALVGRICLSGTGTGTGTGGPGGVGAGSSGMSENLYVYHGLSKIWSSGNCTYQILEPCLIANAAGCKLQVNKYVTGAFHRMVPTNRLPGSGWGSDKCLPIYITTEKKIPRAVGDVLCVHGVSKVYFISDDGCEDELEYGHDAGCCDCGGPPGTGTGTASGCWCTGKPTSSSFTASSFAGLTNGTCLFCSVFPATITMSNSPPTGGACLWAAGTVSDPCGGSLSASLTVGAGGSADLFIGGGAHDVTAHYHLASGFNCNGSNTLTRVSNGTGCNNWPATITVAP